MTAPVNFYADFQGLAALKHSAGKQDPQALREVARQFEGIFTQMMLKSMRAASLGESLFDNEQSKFYMEMFDSQMAVQLSKGRGLGLAEMLVRQLTESGLVAAPAKSAKPDGKIVESLLRPLTTPTSSNIPASNGTDLQVVPPAKAGVHAVNGMKGMDSRLRGNDGKPDVSLKSESFIPVVNGSDLSLVTPAKAGAQKESLRVNLGSGLRRNDDVEKCSTNSPKSVPFIPVVAAPNTIATPPVVVPTKDAVPTDAVPKTDTAPPTQAAPPIRQPIAATPADFIREMWPHAQSAARELGVDARTLIAHAALETGWGKLVPCNPDGSCSFNLFGIKANSRWQGPRVGVDTLEYDAGVAVRRRESFRAYASPAESFRDYAALIKSSPRYDGAVGSGGDAGKFATALQQGGYATDPNYAQKLTATALSVVARAASLLKSVVGQPIASGSSASTAQVRGGET